MLLARAKVDFLKGIEGLYMLKGKNMKKILAVLIVGIATCSCVFANGLGGYGTYWQAKDSDDNAYGVGAKVRLDVLPFISIEGRGNYFPDFQYNEWLKVNVKNLEALATVNLPTETVDLYAGGGAGYYWFEGTGTDGASDPNLDNKVGVFGVAGINIKVAASLVIFFEGKYTWVDANIDDAWEHAKEQDEGKLDGPGASLGIMLAW